MIISTAQPPVKIVLPAWTTSEDTFMYKHEEESLSFAARFWYTVNDDSTCKTQSSQYNVCSYNTSAYITTYPEACFEVHSHHNYLIISSLVYSSRLRRFGHFSKSSNTHNNHDCRYNDVSNLITDQEIYVFFSLYITKTSNAISTNKARCL